MKFWALGLYLGLLTLLGFYSVWFAPPSLLSDLQIMILDPLKAFTQVGGLETLHFYVMGLLPLLHLGIHWESRTFYRPSIWSFWPFTFVLGAFVLVPYHLLRKKLWEPREPKLSGWVKYVWLGAFVLGLGSLVFWSWPHLDPAHYAQSLLENPFYQIMSLDLILFLVLLIPWQKK